MKLLTVQSSSASTFSETLDLCSSPSVRDHVSHPYKTKGKIMGFYIFIFIFKFLKRRKENKRLNRMVGNIPQI
jgi:hypothetical protein